MTTSPPVPRRPLTAGELALQPLPAPPDVAVQGAPRPRTPLHRPVGADVGVVAHRGNSSVAPENTLAAFESARRAGAVWVETDVRRSLDGVAVVIHDPVVDATTDGCGGVAALRSCDLQALDAGTWFSPAYAGLRLPLLPALLSWVAEHDEVRLLLELKGVWSGDEVAAVADLVHEARVTERVVLQSFSVETVAVLALRAPDLLRGLLVEALEPGLAQLVEDLGVVAVNPRVDLVEADPTLVASLQALGVAVCPWTADEPETWHHLVDAGVDAVITNRPDRMLGWLEGRGSVPSRPGAGRT